MMIFLLQRLDIGSDNTAAAEKSFAGEQHISTSARLSCSETMFKARR
jgi:hypothetical protein